MNQGVVASSSDVTRLSECLEQPFGFALTQRLRRTLLRDSGNHGQQLDNRRAPLREGLTPAGCTPYNGQNTASSGTEINTISTSSGKPARQ